MEESITAVETPPQKSTENLPTTVPPQPAVSTFVKVDNNLTGTGFFTASSNRSRKATKKTTVVIDGGVARQIDILPSAEYGLPITQDQDYWLALMQLVDDRRRQEGELINPFTFTTAELTKILGQAHSGKNYKAVQEWLDVMWLTGVRGGAYNAQKKQWLTDRVHVLERAVSVGKELPDGTIADKNNIWFSQWQLDNINSGNLIAIELTTYTQLENNISKNLVPHLQEWLYASQHDGRFEKAYEDVCQLLGIRAYRYRSEIQRNFGPSLDELVTHGYLSKWAIEPMADRKHYKLVLRHGPKYHRDRQTRAEKKSRFETLPAGESAPVHRPPRQRPLKLHPAIEPEAQQPAVIFDYHVIAELQKRGLGESDARALIVKLLSGQPILDQLEYLDFRIQQARGTRKEIKNEPGFYIERLRANVSVPPTFETSRAREARQQAELAEQQARQEVVAKELERTQQADAEATAALADLEATDRDRFQALYNLAKDELFSNPIMARKKNTPEPWHDGAIRARMKKLLPEFLRQLTPPPAVTEPQPSPEVTAASLTPPHTQEELHYATNPAPCQATSLQESVPAAALLNLETFLKTPLLTAPVEQHEASPEPAETQPEQPRSTTVADHLL